MSLLSAATNVPLQCIICPKKPEFSDISHLLTHIASKAHLSNEYKTKVRAAADPQAKELLDEHESWYASYNLGDLMAERLHQKDKRSRAIIRQAKSATSSHAHSGTMATSGIRRASTLKESVLDPQQRRTSTVDSGLASPIRIKQEPASRPGTPVGDLQVPSVYSTAFMPHLHQNSLPASPFTHTTSTLTELQTATPSDESINHGLGHDQPRGARRKRVDSVTSPPDIDEEDAVPGEKEAKLKGVRYKGMDLFDSAPPDMRRKRNQKKATSVVDQLRATSERIEPEERVHDQGFVYRKTRPITGDPTILDTPLPGEETPEPEELPPRKKVNRGARKTRRPMLDKDVNSGRVSRKCRGPSIASTSKPYFKHEDDEYTYGAEVPDDRSTFDVYRDEIGTDVTGPATTGHAQRIADYGGAGSFSGQSHCRHSFTHQRPESTKPQTSSHQRSSPFDIKPTLSPFGNHIGFRPSHSFSNNIDLNGINALSSFGSLTGSFVNNSSALNPNCLHSHHPMLQHNYNDAYQHATHAGHSHSFSHTYPDQQTSQHTGLSPSGYGMDGVDFNNFMGGSNTTSNLYTVSHGLDTFDIFDSGFDAHSASFGGSFDTQGTTDADTNPTNNLLFLNNAQNFAEDDEATLSPPKSERSSSRTS
ncbi:hypothetical protein K431DRAFT_342866 [Polychaeton citri CBS 116435]|uniref:Uncharacterized protein n=1 Tax=Polychaeton citri CBS 116435 TaxID=1314669 RepID=A0A9P4QIB1_9PEZI|nr:hypothetical protein K431DRAFT_342866 [Polychaeton citri CBS 116435]